MLTLGIILALEMFLPLHDKLNLPAAADAGLIALILLGLTITPRADAGTGFVSRLALLMSMIWYMGSLGRWLPQIDSVYQAAPDPASEMLAMALLVVAPVAMIAGPLLVYVPEKIDLKKHLGFGE